MDGCLWLPRASTFSRASKAWMLPKPDKFLQCPKVPCGVLPWGSDPGRSQVPFVLQGGTGATGSRGWKEGVVLGHQFPSCSEQGSSPPHSRFSEPSSPYSSSSALWDRGQSISPTLAGDPGMSFPLHPHLGAQGRSTCPSWV